MAPLDDFIPQPDVRERHTTEIQAPASVAWDALRAFDFQSVTLVRAIIRLREFVLGSRRTPRQSRQPFLEEIASMGWGTLREEPERLLVAGARCQPWQANVVFTPIPANQFASFSPPGQVKIAWTLEVEALTPTTSRLATETRAVATDDEARARFLRYWRWARFGIVSIRWLMLPSIRRSAESMWRGRSA